MIRLDQQHIIVGTIGDMEVSKMADKYKYNLDNTFGIKPQKGRKQNRRVKVEKAYNGGRL